MLGLRRRRVHDPGPSPVPTAAEPPLSPHVPLGSPQIPDSIRQVVSEDLAQPGGLLRRILGAPVARLVRLQQRLLHNVGGIELASQARIKLSLRQEP